VDLFFHEDSLSAGIPKAPKAAQSPDSAYDTQNGLHDLPRSYSSSKNYAFSFLAGLIPARTFRAFSISRALHSRTVVGHLPIIPTYQDLADAVS
jgi:hypothetical protein